MYSDSHTKTALKSSAKRLFNGDHKGIYPSYMKLFCLSRYFHNSPKPNYAFAQNEQHALEQLFPEGKYNPKSGEWDSQSDISIYPVKYSDVDSYYGGNHEKILPSSFPVGMSAVELRKL